MPEDPRTSPASAPDAGGAVNGVIELRRYRLRPGARDRLIALFDRHFVESQEETGMRILGQFRDLDDPDAFVWLRGFRDMHARAAALEAFYGGPVWARYAGQARATMVNTDNVLLLRPARPGMEMVVAPAPRAPIDAEGSGRGVVVATVCSLPPETEAGFGSFFCQAIAPTLTAAGARIVAALASEHSPNTYPRLPVRAGETVFAWMLTFADLDAYRSYLDALARMPVWTETHLPELNRRAWRRDVSILVPTARSLLHGRA
jgi:quinol monooxygenase YgiN